MALPSTFDSVATMKDREGERKVIDSPLTTQTDVSSSYNDDEHSLLTPPTMPSRLGRIVISSNVSPSGSGSGESYVLTNAEDESESESSRTSSHRRLNLRMRPSASRKLGKEVAAQNESSSSSLSSPSSQQQQQQQALTNALHQLHRLATLDSTEYQQRLLENTLPDLQRTKKSHFSLYCPALTETSSASASISSPPSTQELSQLAQPIQTPLVQLSMSIHRLHAVVANITREVDGHTDEVQELQSQLQALRRRNKKVETAAKTVHKKNLRLLQQAKHDRRIAHGLEQKVHQYEAQLESQGFQLMVSKVQQHETQLQLRFKNNQQGTSDDGSRLRERVDSTMSDFLDIEEDSQDYDEDNNYYNNSESVQTISTADAESPTRLNTSDSFVSFESDLSGKSRENNSRRPVFIFSKEGTFAPDYRTTPTRSRGKSSSSSNSTVSASTVDCEVVNHGHGESSKGPSPKKQITNPVSGKERPTETVDAKINTGSFSNRFAKFLGATRTVSNYNLKIVTPCNIQFVEIPTDALTMEENQKEKQQSIDTTASTNTTTQVVEDHGIIVPIDDGSIRSLDDERLSPDSEKARTFAVCGLDGFNTTLNMKPTVGAQLTKINGKMISERWTLQTLYSELEKYNTSSTTTSIANKNSSKKHVVLTFRNERWDTEQTKILNAAIQEVAIKGAASHYSNQNHAK